MSDSVRTKIGVPTLRDFLSSDGTPIVIDVTTDKGYYLYKNVVRPLVGGDPIGPAFSSGFSTGFDYA